MTASLSASQKSWLSYAAGVGLLLILGLAAWATHGTWLPRVQSWVQNSRQSGTATDSRNHGQSPGHDDHGHGDHGHGHAHSDADSLELSPQARRSLGLKTAVVKPESYFRTIGLPAMVVERPGRSQVEVTAPLTGVVTKIYPIEGQAVEPGGRLFELRLTHEELVAAQRDFLRTAEELDVVRAEIKRLEGISSDVIAGKRILEQKYEQQKLQGAQRAQQQALLLHGLSQQQVDQILKTRRLLPGLTVVTPPFADNIDHHKADQHVYVVQNITVKPGQQVEAGRPLAMLADHCLLYVEGKAFEEDAETLNQATEKQRPIMAFPVSGGRREGAQAPLEILYVADQIDPESRALRFYMSLPNTIVRDVKRDGVQFIGWRYKPGQRMEVRVPVEQWENQIVLPVEAVVEDGAEAFVFEQNGNHFDRVRVSVAYRDQDNVVLHNDGALTGSTLAVKGAYQMHLALKNQAGGGVDPHAGHSH